MINKIRSHTQATDISRTLSYTVYMDLQKPFSDHLHVLDTELDSHAPFYLRTVLISNEDNVHRV